MGSARVFAMVECLSGGQRTWEWTVSVREMGNEFARKNDSVHGKVLLQVGFHGDVSWAYVK